MIELIPYEIEYCDCWNQVVNDAANGYFIFQRQYMDYHEDRHQDASYIAFNKGIAVAVLPATKVDNSWVSHGGLTFGGLIIASKYNKIAQIMDIYRKLFEQLKQLGFHSALIKPLPWIYHNSICEGELYVLQQLEEITAKTSYETTTTVDLGNQVEVSKLRLRKKNKAVKAQLKITKAEDFTEFYQVLKQRLMNKYAKKPVHSLEELHLLYRRFPSNISLYTITNQENSVLGGCVIYSSNNVWHSQYVAATDKGMELGALDLLFLQLIETAKEQNILYFDFGISTENNGKYLNESLVSFKEGFGGRSIVHQKIHLQL